MEESREVVYPGLPWSRPACPAVSGGMLCILRPGHSCSWERPGLSLLALHEYSLHEFP